MKRIIDKLRKERQIRVGYGTAFFILLISYVVTLYFSSKVLEQSNTIRTSNEVVTNLDVYMSMLKDAELGFKGFIISGDTDRLDAYNKTRSKASVYFYNIFPEPQLEKKRAARLKTIKELSDSRFKIIDSAVTEFKANNYAITEKLLVLEAAEESNAIALRNIIQEIQVSERNGLLKESAELERLNAFLNSIIIISLVLALFLFVFAFITYSREQKARKIADIRAEEYRKELEQRIEELNNANKELKEMRRLEKFTITGRIARTIAHEVRNPLTNINLSIEHLKSEPSLEFGYRTDFYDMIVRNSQRINGLITTLLNSTGLTELQAEKDSINDLLDETLKLAEDRITLNGIKVIRGYSENICEVNVDKGKMTIAFLNIIVNAIEAMENGKGVLKITTSSKADKCIIIIADNGKGMDDETVNKLFEPYYTKKAGGTGLGLTNAANIILSHKGNIHVESSVDGGTRFEISIDFA